MREILFRAKCKLKGKWMYGYYRVSGGKHYINSTKVYENTVGQFTGSTGKNGTKIFEGDLFNFKKAGLYEVIFSRQYGFIMRSLSNPNHWVPVAHYKHLEPVGTIYEGEV